MNPKIKILVAYHKPATLLKSDIFVPVQSGRAIEDETALSAQDKEWLHKNCISDNTGDNISSKNSYYNELCVMYWAWKNYDKLGNPDYIGLMHYRRHLCFDLNNMEEPDKYGLLYSSQLDANYIQKYQLQEKSILNALKGYDVLVGQKLDMHKLGPGSPYQQYKTVSPDLNIQDMDNMVGIICRKRPEYKGATQEYLHGAEGYFTNIFVASKKWFFDYCEWLFPLLKEAECLPNPTTQTEQQIRLLGHLGERLQGIYLTYQYQHKVAKIRELKRTLVGDMRLILDIKPRVKGEISVCMSSSEAFAPYLAVTLQSLIDHASASLSYTAYILDDGLTADTKRVLNSIQTSNVQFRYMDISRYLAQYPQELFYTYGWFSKATYARFFIPHIFAHFEKIVYCDCDAIFLQDVADVFHTDLKGFLFGAARDIEAERQWLSGDQTYEKVLHLTNPSEYFQAGLLVCNIEQMKQFDMTAKCLSTLRRLKTPRYLDQDVLNVVCKGKIRFLEDKWNVENLIPIYHKNWANEMPYRLRLRYRNALQSAGYLHYAGGIKPWQDPTSFNAHIWWQYARKTPYYEILLQRLYNQTLDYKLKQLCNYRKLYWKYKRYCIKRYLSWGKKRKYYKQKIQEMRDELRQIYGMR
ncbi:MAG: DUF4422 domain-containing protein [Elusimicrobiaceae bacterium]|nr:DUF4422 domain-containing protein [Elusimicrobiaceae bacterium]